MTLYPFTTNIFLGLLPELLARLHALKILSMIWLYQTIFPLSNYAIVDYTSFPDQMQSVIVSIFYAFHGRIEGAFLYCTVSNLLACPRCDMHI
jgi:hypothetical protein